MFNWNFTNILTALGIGKKEIVQERASPMSLFDDCLVTVLKFEGGYSNDPSDPGGETNYGITKKVAVAAGYQGDMKSIPMDAVKQIYKHSYWDALYLDNISSVSQDLAKLLFDTAVNTGNGRAAKWLQIALNAENKAAAYADIVADGTIGQKTLTALATLDANAVSMVIMMVEAQRVVHYTTLASTDPKFRKYINGWLGRTKTVLGS